MAFSLVDIASLLCTCAGLIHAGGLFYLPYPIASFFRFLWLALLALSIYLPASFAVVAVSLIMVILLLLLFVPRALSNSACEFADSFWTV